MVDEELAAAEAWVDRSSVRVCRAAERLVCASSTSLLRSLGSSLPITCPALTTSPILTSTAATVPATAKDASVRSTSLSDPAAATDWLTDPTLATAVR